MSGISHSQTSASHVSGPSVSCFWKTSVRGAAMFGSSLASTLSVLFAFAFSTPHTASSIAPSDVVSSTAMLTASTGSVSGQTTTEATHPGGSQAAPTIQEPDPLKRPLPEKKKKSGKNAFSKGESAYKNW